MTAILLFSAVIHIGALALAMVHVLSAWEGNRAEPAGDDWLRACLYFGLGVGVFAAILTRLGHGAGHALATGITAGLVAGLLLALISQIRLTAPSMSGDGWHRRPQVLVFYGTFALLEVLAVAFLVMGLTGLAAGR